MNVQRDPVADLLNDEQRARVRAATFVRHPRLYGQAVAAKIGRRWCCPLAVAFGLEGSPSAGTLCEVLGKALYGPEHQLLSDFTWRCDHGGVEPADVKAVLGCEPHGRV